MTSFATSPPAPGAPSSPADDERRRPPLDARVVRLWIAQTASEIGTAASGVAVAVHVFVETGSGWWLGVLAGIAALPAVLIAPALRRIDRRDRRSVVLAADVAAVVAVVIAGAVLALDRGGPIALVGLVAATSAARAVQAPALAAIWPSLVPDGAIDRVNGLNQLTAATGLVLGPLLAAALLGLGGLHLVFALDVVVSLVAIVATALLVPPSLAPARPSDDGSWAVALEWLRSVAARPVRVVLGVVLVSNGALAMFNVATLALATDVLGPTRVGVPLALGGVAMLVSSAVVGARGLPADRRLAVAVGIAGVGVGCVITASRPAAWLVVLGVVVSLAAAPLVGAAISTVCHERVPPSMYGRVFALRGAVASAVAPVSSVVAGGLMAVVAARVVASPERGLGATVIAVLGDGVGRGPAAVLAIVALALVAVAGVVALGRPWSDETRTYT